MSKQNVERAAQKVPGRRFREERYHHTGENNGQVFKSRTSDFNPSLKWSFQGLFQKYS